MRTTTILTLSLALLARADDFIDAKKVPAVCTSVCQPPRDLARLCDVGGDNVSDRAKAQQETQCICTNESFDVARFFGLCASCLEQNVGQAVVDDEGLRTKDLDDINRRMKSCGFSATTFSQDDAKAGDGVKVSLNGNSGSKGGNNTQSLQPSRTGSASGTGTVSTSRPNSSGTGVVTGGASGVQASVGVLAAAVAAVAAFS